MSYQVVLDVPTDALGLFRDPAGRTTSVNLKVVGAEVPTTYPKDHLRG